MTEAGVAFVTTRWVEPGREDDYKAWTVEIEDALRQTPGFVAFEQLPAIEGEQDFWTQIVRFDNRQASVAWAQSPKLAELLKEISSYTTDSEVASVRTGKRDPDLSQYDEVWAAAGTWNDNFGAAPADIVRVAGGVVVDLKRA